MRRRYFIPIIVSLLVLIGCAQPSAGPTLLSGEAKQIIEIKAVDQILNYQCQVFWSEEKYSELLADKVGFKSKEIDSLQKSLERHNKHIVNPNVEFDEARKSTILMCDVKGATYNTNSYDFHWLLGDLPFDLYQFKQSEKELYYEGEVNGVPTTIRLVFAYTIDHCHEHVWPAK